MASLKSCLSEARSYWDGPKASNTPEGIQTVRARVCTDLVGPHVVAGKLTAKDATRLLRKLADKGLARKTISDYYSTFKRMLQLNGEQPKDLARWPKAPRAPRKVREPITPGDFSLMVEALYERGFGETADLAILLDAIGGRVQREVLLSGNLLYRTRNGVLFVKITGKGGHQREVPIGSKRAIAIIEDRQRYRAILAIPYKTHLWRWNKIRGELGIEGLTTFHSIRHKYATELLGKTKNLRLVQEALGHSNPATTAIYAHVNVDEMVRALQE